MKHTLLAVIITGSFVAPAGAQTRRTPAPVQQSATVDIASAFQQRYRAMIEPLVFGRFTLGITGEYTTEPDNENYYLYPAEGCAPTQLCARFSESSLSAPCCGYSYSTGEGYRAWSFNLHARWYPQALSIRGGKQSAAFYVGEFIGFHERRISQFVYYGCPYCYDVPPRVDSGSVVPDTTIKNPTDPYPGGPTPVGGTSITQKFKGWEPGVEFGARVWATQHVVIDVGGRFRLVRIDDYQSGQRPGDVDKRLSVSVGIGW